MEVTDYSYSEYYDVKFHGYIKYLKGGLIFSLPTRRYEVEKSCSDISTFINESIDRYIKILTCMSDTIWNTCSSMKNQPNRIVLLPKDLFKCGNDDEYEDVIVSFLYIPRSWNPKLAIFNYLSATALVVNYIDIISILKYVSKQLLTYKLSGKKSNKIYDLPEVGGYITVPTFFNWRCRDLDLSMVKTNITSESDMNA